jgi:hypothetical protein
MINRVVTFGDSWTWGAELKNPDLPKTLPETAPDNDVYRLHHVYGGHVARHLGANFENHGSNGQSLQSMIWTFEWWLDNNSDYKDCLLIFGLTQHVRNTWWQQDKPIFAYSKPWDKYLHSIWLESDNGKDWPLWHQAQKVWRTNADEDLYRKNYQSAVYLFSGTCQRLGIPCIMFNIFAGMPEIPHSTVANQGSSACQYLNQIEKNLSKPIWAQDHPNELGQKLLADWLISQL